MKQVWRLAAETCKIDLELNNGVLCRMKRNEGMEADQSTEAKCRDKTVKQGKTEIHSYKSDEAAACRQRASLDCKLFSC